MEKLRHWRWEDPLYAAEYRLLCGPAFAGKAWVNRYVMRMDEDEDFHAGGKMIFCQDGQGAKIVIWMPHWWSSKIPATTASLAHECFHATASLLLQRGLQLTDESDEAFAYHLGWLYEECYRRLNA